MSSRYVRENILSFLDTNYTTSPVIDLSGIIDGEQLPKVSDFVGVQFAGATETLQGLNNCFREIGTIVLFSMKVATGIPSDDVDASLTVAEELRDILRRQNINEIIITQTDPPEFNNALGFNATGLISCSVAVSYQREFRE